MPFPRLLITLFSLLLLGSPALADILTYPYIQDLQAERAELCWVSHQSSPVRVTWNDQEAHSQVLPAEALQYHPVEREKFPSLDRRPRYLHRVTLDHLQGTRTEYLVHFPDQPYRNSFKSLPRPGDGVLLIAYSDSETEPESTGKAAKWGTTEEPSRRYLVDQTSGYRANLAQIQSRDPNAILVAGDLVESGGEQRDWDEFWSHQKELAGAVPLLTAPGNHEYFAGPRGHGAYETEASRLAIAKYRTYFQRPYYSKVLGPVHLISLDSNDSLPHQSAVDSNHYLEAAGEFAPGFHPQSEQYAWLERELAVAQKEGRFILVMFHHCPYSSGVHGFPAGSGEGQDPQSGQALRSLTPLFLRYGVEVVISGHDEMMERSEVSGIEITPEGSERPVILQVYDVGIGGDGLREPERDNEYQRFLAHQDSPEIWQGEVLKSGGRHYGHLEIEVVPSAEGWTATLTPVYLLPVQQDGEWTFERKEYPDQIRIQKPTKTGSGTSSMPKRLLTRP
ncbi:MAG: metallophosphoesterase [Vulcanimicrobiota bacterium]